MFTLKNKNGPDMQTALEMERELKRNAKLATALNENKNKNSKQTSIGTEMTEYVSNHKNR